MTTEQTETVTAPQIAPVERMQSEDVGELMAALAAAQAEMSHAKKDRKNPHFGSTYADLASVVDACGPALNKHGIAYVQGLVETARGWRLRTELWLKNQFKAYDVPFAPPKGDPQTTGSYFTYLRRYALAAI